MTPRRLSRDQYLMLEAQRFAAERGTCPRAVVGAVIARGNEIISRGCNGAPPKMPHCSVVGCRMHEGHCVRAIHAEDNALHYAGRERTRGATIYVTHFPCLRCCNLIIRAGIRCIVYGEEYREQNGTRDLLKRAGIDVRRLTDEN